MSPVQTITEGAPHLFLQDVTAGAPHALALYATSLTVLCVILAAILLFIETVAHAMKKAMTHVVDLLALPPSFSSSSSHDRGLPPSPTAALHELLDRTCPLQSHTPPELPAVRVAPGLPVPAETPCTLCHHGGIYLGQLRRALPCGHVFHARCIDRATLITSTEIMLECPVCQFVVVPTPDLVDGVDSDGLAAGMEQV